MYIRGGFKVKNKISILGITPPPKKENLPKVNYKTVTDLPALVIMA